MVFLVFLSLFFPLGVFILLNPSGRANSYKVALSKVGVGPRMLTCISMGWVAAGSLGIIGLFVLLG